MLKVEVLLLILELIGINNGYIKSKKCDVELIAWSDIPDRPSQEFCDDWLEKWVFIILPIHNHLNMNKMRRFINRCVQLNYDQITHRKWPDLYVIVFVLSISAFMNNVNKYVLYWNNIAQHLYLYNSFRILW